MTIDDALYAYLTNVATQTGQLIGSRLYPLQLPQNPTYPAMTYQEIDASLTAVGQSVPGDLEEALIQFDCYGSSHKAARTLSQALRADLSGFRGTMGALNVGACHFHNEYDLWGEKAKTWRITVEFRIFFNV